MPTLLSMNQAASLHDDLSYLHITVSTTLDPSQQVVVVAAAAGNVVVTLPTVEECEGRDFHIYREDATNTVTIAPPTGNKAFAIAQVLTADIDAYSLVRAIHGRWFVVDSKLA